MEKCPTCNVAGLNSNVVTGSVFGNLYEERKKILHPLIDTWKSVHLSVSSVSGSRDSKLTKLNGGDSEQKT